MMDYLDQILLGLPLLLPGEPSRVRRNL